MIINNIEEIIHNLHNDTLTPEQAIEVTCRCLKIGYVTMDKNPAKEEVLKELYKLLDYKEMPMIWGTTPTYLKPFSIKEIFN